MYQEQILKWREFWSVTFCTQLTIYIFTGKFENFVNFKDTMYRLFLEVDMEEIILGRKSEKIFS